MSAAMHHELTDDEFFDRFQPIKNHLNDNAAFDGCLFETFGPELAFVQSQPASLVWTVLDCDGQMFIGEGFHFVDRLGYLIASTPFEQGHSYSVPCEDLGED